MAMSEEFKEILAKIREVDPFSTDPEEVEKVNKIFEEIVKKDIMQDVIDGLCEENICIKSKLEARLKRADEFEVENAELKARLEMAVEFE